MSLEAPASRAQAVDRFIARRREPWWRPIGARAIQNSASAATCSPSPTEKRRSEPARPMKRGWAGLSSSSRRGLARPCRLACSSSPTAGRRSRIALGVDRAGVSRAGRADPRRAGGRRADLGRRGRAGHRRPRDARPGTRVPVRVTLRSRGYDGERTELLDPIGRRSQGESRWRRCPSPSSTASKHTSWSSRPTGPRAPLTVEVSPLPHEADRRQQRRPVPDHVRAKTSSA